MSHRPAGLILALGLLATASDRPGGRALAADEDRERPVMERFLAVLERNPRRGTALDRVYGFHVERGELDKLVQGYRDRAAKDPKDGTARLLLGLIEAQAGRDAAAVAAFRSAEEARPDDPLPSFYLGQSLVLVGQPDEAAEAFERALARNPSRVDLLEVYQALGRVHQRARHDEKATAVWSRMEKAFPDDPRVQEQVAAALAEDGKVEPALARYSAMADAARDPYRRVRFRLEAADLEVKLGRKADALRDYERLLSGLDPESWIAREVRRKIEDVFQRDDDQAGLVQYYQRWVEKSPEDVDAMSRLARALAVQGRSAEARSALDKALKLAPSNRALRLALIEQLARERKFAEAAAQYEAMAKLDPGNPDVVRDWGRMLLRDESKPPPDRKIAASKVWQRLVDARPDDPSALAMVAELDRQAGLETEALALYRKAVDLAPAMPQYREYLGEYLHNLKRPAEALAAWRGMAEGPRRDAADLERLGQVLAGYGYKAEAVEAIAQAIKLDPASFPLRLRLAGLLSDARRFDEAEAQLVAAGPLADDEARREELLARQIALDEASGKLPARVEAIRREAGGPKANDPATWTRLARYEEAARRPVDATVAAEKAVALDGSAVAARATLARLYESIGRLGEAADAWRALAAIDRRARVEHLSSVARLEARLGRKDEALRAAREVLEASPGNPESLNFYADLCFQLGEVDPGLDALRRAARAHENDLAPVARLAEALAREFRTEEAIELDWKLFEKTGDLDERLKVVARLADLHIRRNQFDRLVGRLERLQAEDGKRREATFCLAQAHATLGDHGAARRELEGLLEANGRDTALLKQLSRLAEDEGDITAALKFQQRLDEVAPDRDSSRRLAQLAVAAGEIDLAESIWSRSTELARDQAQLMGALSNLAANGRNDAILATTGRMLRDDPGNWEALYREGRTLTALGRFDEAAGRFEALLALRRDDDEPSAIVKGFRKMTPRPTTDGAGVEYWGSIATTTARYVSGLMPDPTAGRLNGWTPRDYGQARIAALAHELARARRAGTEAEWLAARRPIAGKPVDARAAWDALFVAYLFDDQKQIYEAARDVVRAVGHGPNSDFVLLNTLPSRTNTTGVRVVPRVTDEPAPDRTPPLPPAEVDLVRDALRSMIRDRSSRLDMSIARSPMTELTRAGRLGEIEADYRALVDSANDHPMIQFAGQLAADRGDVDTLRKLYQAFYRLPAGNRPPTPTGYGVTTPQGTFSLPTYYMAQGMKPLADSGRYADILRLVDDDLTASRSPDRVEERARAARGSGSTRTSATANRYPVFFSARQAVQIVDYPTPNLHLEVGSILLLRGAYSSLKRDDKAADLIDHLRKLADGAKADPSAERQARLALSAVLWWDEKRDPAVAELARAIQLTPGDVDLKLAMAELRAIRREPEEALAAVEAVESVDQDATRRRELLALRLAASAGRPERARQAAERLFGLRLDPPTLVQLAAQMHQLGLHELADAVLARTRRQVGNNASGLSDLMAEYRRQGNLDAASQVAVDVLRRRSSNQILRPGMMGEDPNRRQAMEILAASGKLDEMIARLEAQVKESPRSLPLQQSLASYYAAAGRLDKLKATNEALLKLRPDDTALRMQVANQLAQAGDLDGAIGHYRAAAQHDPATLATYSAAIFANLQQAGRFDDLLALIDAVGLKTLNDPISVRALIVALLKDPKTADQGANLLVRTVEAYPLAQQATLSPIAMIDSFWKRPDAYDVARNGVLPTPGVPLADVWSGIGDSPAFGGFGQDGRMTILATRVLDAASRLGKLDDLAAATEAAQARTPAWQGGRGLLAAIKIRRGRVDEGRADIEKILADRDARPTFGALAILGQEVRDVPSCGPLAMALYERAAKTTQAVSIMGLYLRCSPAWNLALIHHKAGRLAEALAVARQAEETARSTTSAGSGASVVMAAYRTVSVLAGLGALYLEIGDHADALRVLDEFFGSTEEMELAKTYPTLDRWPAADTLVAPAREAARRALDGLTPATLPLALEMLIRPTDPTRPVDLRVAVVPREVDRATVRSLLASAIDLAGRDPATLARVKGDLDAIAKAHPGDFEARTALALLDREPGALAPAASALDRMADESPLAPLATGARADARGRDEAARRLGLWLVARRCWEHDSTAEVGDRLAARGLDAARRLPDPATAMAMLRELARRALDRGDRPAARSRMALLLALHQQDALARPTPPAVAMGRPTPNPATPRPNPATSRLNPATSRPRSPAYVLNRFRQATEFAALAGESGMLDLALGAVRESLKGGPPVVPMPLTTVPQPNLRVTASGTGSTEPPPDPVPSLVGSKLVALDAAWAAAGVAPGAAYEVLRDVVLPAARPAEIFLYDPSTSRIARASAADAPARPGEVARLLARRARLAGKLDDLRRVLDERKDLPPSRDAARRLLAAIDEAAAEAK